MDAATSVVGMKKAVEAMTEAVDDALANVKSRACLHLPSLDAAMYEDGENTLDELARMGYTELEVGAYFGDTVHDRGVEEFKQMTRRAGLRVESIHLSREYKPEPQNEQGEQGAQPDTPKQEQLWWTRAMDVACELGCKSVVMSGIPPFAEQDMESMARCYAEYFARVEGMASQRGLKFCYHPSAAELKAFGGISFLDLVADDATACEVKLQLDTFEALVAGVDVCSLLRRYKDRVESLHLHDIDVVCQSEQIDFERVVRCANECGVENLIIEQHNFTLPPLSSVERSLQNVMTLPSVKW
jgi:sugar phosphate isomerase/epimerase